MEGLESQINPEVWAQIQEQFEKLQNESGVEIDEDYQKELEQLFGMTYDEMNREAEIAMKTRTLQVELIHEDAKFPTYAYPSDSGFDLTSVEDIDIVAGSQKYSNFLIVNDELYIYQAKAVAAGNFELTKYKYNGSTFPVNSTATLSSGYASVTVHQVAD